MIPFPTSFKLPPQLPSTAPTLSRTETSVQTTTGPDRLSAAPSGILDMTAQWLSTKETCNLMSASKRHHQFFTEYYQKRLQPFYPRSSMKPAQAYNCPEMRRDRYLPLDRAGRTFLASQDIHFPLTKEIQNGKMTVRQATEFISKQRQFLNATLTGPRLTKRQKQYLKNPLFAEHFLSDRCDMETAIRLATGQGLFCSMTLQGLFRSGDLLPTDLEEISNPGFQLLHDPLLSNLYQTGLIGKRELLELTKNQIESLLICRPALLSKKLAMKEVLALTAEQMQSMRVAKLLDLLYAERITLSEALKLAHDLSISNSMQASAGLKLATVAIMIPFPELPDCSLYFKLKPPFLSDSPVLLKQFQLRKLLSKTPITTVTKALDTGGDLTWFVEFGKVIHHLHPNVIVQHLDTSTMAHRCIFARFDDGLDSNGAEEAALAYIQLYISLAGKLDSEDYLLVVQPFLQDVFGWMVADACRRDHGDIIDQCSKVFTLALTKWMLTARPQAQLWDLVMPQFKQHCAELDLLNSSAECYCLISFARLLCAMSLMHNVEFFKFWGAGDDYDRPEDADMEAHEYRPYFMQALYSPFNPVESGARILDSIAGYIDKHR